MATPLRAAALGLIALLCVAPAGAQEEAKPAAPAEPEKPAPKAIAVSEIAARAEKLTGDLRKIASDAEPQPQFDAMNEGIAERKKRLRDEEAALSTSLSSTFALRDLDTWGAAWRGLRDEIGALQKDVTRRLEAIDQRLANLGEREEVWNLTRSEARKAGAPEAVVGVTTKALSDIRKLTKSFETRRNALLDLQTRLGEQSQRTADALAQIDSAREKILSDIFARDRVPLWELEPDAHAESFGEAAGAWRGMVATISKEYAARHPLRVALHVALIALFFAVVLRARPALDRRLTEAGDTGDVEGRVSTRRAFDHPFAAAIVLGALATPWIHPDLPRPTLGLLAIVLVVPAAVVLLRSLLPAPLRPIIYSLTLLFLADRVRDVLHDFPMLSRVIFVVEIAAALGVLVFLQRTARLAQIPPSLQMSPWFKALAFWLRLSLSLLAFVLVAELLGYGRLAALIGEAVLNASYLALLLVPSARIAGGLTGVVMRQRFLQRSRMIRNNTALFVGAGRRIIRAVALGLWLLALLSMLAIQGLVFEALGSALTASVGYGAFSISIGGVLAFAGTLFVTWLLARAIHFTLNQEIYPRVLLPRGVPYALSTLTRYAVFVLGFLVAASLLGVNPDRLTLLASAVGVGVGFGLQTVVSNFVSGLILLFERPVQVGDRIELGTLSGDIKRIGIRSSTVRTFDGADVVVPNASLIAEPVTNWTLSDRTRRIILPVGVAYGTDPERVLTILREIGQAHEKVLDPPGTTAIFRGFGESSLDFEMRVFIDDYDRRLTITSELAVSVNAALAEAGIEIPFPQRDLHLRSVDEPAGAELRRQG